MLAHSPVKEDYKVLKRKIVSSLESKDCMLHCCDECPETEALKKFLEDAFELENIDPEDIIQFKRWIHTEQDTLEATELTSEEFIEELV